MNQVLSNQIKTVSREKDEIKKRLKKLDEKFAMLEKYAKHAKDIAFAREQTKRGEAVPQEKVLHNLGI
ncbi:MAG: hypothetical protein HYT63_01775 [Candidatus Yanofskybacteria bacterium]|nr:hypothetical protein [Candidatus Yanofskybacteria bacterium]